jgi:predicted sugar kinase
MHNLVVNGGDMNKEPPSTSTILRMTHQEHSEDWEVVVKLPTPKKLFFLKL